MDYTFTAGTKEAKYKNPMTFLKQGDELIMGVSVIEKVQILRDEPLNIKVNGLLK